jgi:hypothetical protein
MGAISYLSQRDFVNETLKEKQGRLEGGRKGRRRNKREREGGRASCGGECSPQDAASGLEDRLQVDTSKYYDLIKMELEGIEQEVDLIPLPRLVVLFPAQHSSSFRHLCCLLIYSLLMLSLRICDSVVPCCLLIFGAVL